MAGIFVLVSIASMDLLAIDVALCVGFYIWNGKSSGTHLATVYLPVLSYLIMTMEVKREKAPWLCDGRSDENRCNPSHDPQKIMVNCKRNQACMFVTLVPADPTDDP